MKRTSETYTEGYTSAIAWAGLVGAVAVYDALAPQTLSEGFHKAMETRARPLLVAAVALTGAHLLRPHYLSAYDPITRFGTALRGFTRG